VSGQPQLSMAGFDASQTGPAPAALNSPAANHPAQVTAARLAGWDAGRPGLASHVADEARPLRAGPAGGDRLASRTESSVVNVAGLVQGIVLVTFPAASTICTGKKRVRAVKHPVRQHVSAAGDDGHRGIAAWRRARPADQHQTGLSARPGL